MEWLQARFAEVSPEEAEESEPSELADLKAEMMKNKKRIKSMMAMLEAQNKLLRTLALKIDPKFGLPEGAAGEWGADRMDGGKQAPLDEDKESEEVTDDTSVELAREEKSADALFESGF